MPEGLDRALHRIAIASSLRAADRLVPAHSPETSRSRNTVGLSIATAQLQAQTRPVRGGSRRAPVGKYCTSQPYSPAATSVSRAARTRCSCHRWSDETGSSNQTRPRSAAARPTRIACFAVQPPLASANSATSSPMIRRAWLSCSRSDPGPSLVAHGPDHGAVGAGHVAPAASDHLGRQGVTDHGGACRRSVRPSQPGDAPRGHSDQHHRRRGPHQGPVRLGNVRGHGVDGGVDGIDGRCGHQESFVL